MLAKNNMKKSSTTFQDKRERCVKNIPLILSSLFIASILCLFFLISPKPLTLLPNQGPDIFDDDHPQHNKQENLSQTTKVSSSSSNSKPQKEENKCDLFKGHWVPSLEGESSYYTNSSCTTIPDSKNCFRHGRMDTDFLKWKWKPHECELPRFNPTSFLNIVGGKKMAFIGDSVARNHMESLLCLLSQEDTPKDMYKDPEDKYRKWYFPKHDFTLMMIWSRFLIVGEERIVNGTGSSIFDLHLDKVDEDWANIFPELDYAIISDGHWFFRVMYLHKGNKLIGCVYCNEQNVTNYNIDLPIRMAFRTTFMHINGSKNKKRGLLTVLRTFAPAHFENGVWNNGGYCNRTSPLSEAEADFGSFDWQLRSIQMEEFERAKREKGEKRLFEILDVTLAMLLRPDGHPGDHWGNKWMKGYNDCTHWCLPGPVDLWSEFLLALLIRSQLGILTS
ncbi:xyloglucan O-acetyltransferase 4-like [Arachis stenosperma]|uniref:xyloglucan O-acetyltransferase 4-like n=1 Tax=Arachis stenosperma TaxID=217475 RepID=UPI0025ABA2C0|nr:xyloglucan O-acetyltransferase 4-like [Arachis stenosperma]